MPYGTFTLKGQHRTASVPGKAHEGLAKVTPNTIIRDTGGDVVMSGEEKVPLDETGAWSLVLPCDSPGLNPSSGIGYTVAFSLYATGMNPVSFYATADLAGSTLDVSDIVSVAVPTPLSAIVGPQGEPGADGAPGQKGDPGTPGAKGDPGDSKFAFDTDGTPYYGTTATPNSRVVTEASGDARYPLRNQIANPAGWNVARFISKMQTGNSVKVTVLGDSIYQGSTAGAPGTDDAVSILCTTLASRFGVTVTKSNRANGGRTAFWERIDAWALSLADNADLYVIGMTGKNDNTWEANGANNARLTGYRTAESLATVEAMIRELRAVKPKADILIASGNPYGTVYATSNVFQLAYTNGLARLAAAYGCGYADSYTPFPRDSTDATSAAASYLSDGTHPNSLGHAVLATALLGQIPATLDVTKVSASALVDAAPAGTAVYPVRTARTGILALTSQGLTANTDRIPNPAFFGTWAGTGPWTTSTAGAIAVGMAKASEFFLKFKMGAGQGVVDLYVNARPVATNVDLSTLQDGKYLATKTVAPGVNYVSVKVKSGSVEFQGFSYTASVGEWIDVDSARVAVTNPGTVAAGTVFYGGRQHTVLASTILSFDFVGTGVAVVVSRGGTGGGAYWASVSVDGVTTNRPDLPADWDGQGAHVLASGLTYGRHTVVLTSIATLTVGGFSVFDERPEDHPTVCEGMAKVGETVRFPYPWTDTPTVIVTSTTANAASPTTVTASSFVVSGTAGDLVKWRATSQQRGIY